MSNILVIVFAWLWINFAPSSCFLWNDFFFLISRFYVDLPDDDISEGISEVLRRTTSLNCKSIVSPLSQVEIPAKKKRNQILKIVNAITNDIQQDNLNEFQIIRVITDTKFLVGEFLRNFKLVRKTSASYV